MKAGDLVKYRSIVTKDKWEPVGTVIDFPQARHAKESQKVRVLQEDGTLQNWVLQFCEVVSES